MEAGSPENIFMRQYFNANIYKWLVYSIILTPNIFAAIIGLESFPYTSAPMFGHYVGEETKLYLIKLEGIKGEEGIDLAPYYGRPESYFIRYFFSKVYGSRDKITAFNGRLSENPGKFQKRLDEFFTRLIKDVHDKHQLDLQKIYLKAIQVDEDRNPLGTAIVLGYFDAETNQYTGLYEADK